MPTEESSLGALARDAMPTLRQIFIGPKAGSRIKLSGIDLERRAYVIRKRIEHEITTRVTRGAPAPEHVYFPSLSSRTIVYKGMLTTPQLRAFYLDLQDERVESALGLVHSRFSTNTFPSWPLAHPFRRVAHNGEINTVTGNENWMRARESLITTDVFGGAEALEKIFPVCTPGASDTARFDEVLELLHLGGRSLPHAVLMMIPEAWERHESMKPGPPGVLRVPRRADGAVGRAGIGHVHRRHPRRRGARPQRPAAEPDLGHRRRPRRDGVGGRRARYRAVEGDPKVRLQPGRMFLVDTEQGRIVADEEIKDSLAAEHPYQAWLDAGQTALSDLPYRPHVHMPHDRVLIRQQIFGYTNEELSILVSPMAKTGAEAIGSMGTDTPIAVLSARPRLLFDYFSQLFAQVTNPPLDAIREEVVTSLGSGVGPEGDVLSPGPDSCKQIVLDQPILTNDELAKLVHINDENDQPDLRSVVVRGLYPSPRVAPVCARRSTRSRRRSAPRLPAVHGSSCCPTASPTRSWRRSRRCC